MCGVGVRRALKILLGIEDDADCARLVVSLVCGANLGFAGGVVAQSCGHRPASVLAISLRTARIAAAWNCRSACALFHRASRFRWTAPFGVSTRTRGRSTYG